MKYCITFLLVLIIVGPFLVSTLPFYNLGIVSTMVLAVEVLLLLYCFFYALKRPKDMHIPKDAASFVAIYFIYYAVVFYQIFVAPVFPRDELGAVPETNLALFRTFFVQTGELLMLMAFYRSIDFKLFAKITVYLTALLLVAYYNKVNFLVYGFEDVDYIQMYEDEERIASFNMAGFMAMAFFCNFAIRKDYSSSKTVSTIIFTIFAVLFAMGLFITIKRGPIVSFLFVVAILFLRNRSKVAVVSIALLALVFLIWQDSIMSLFDNSSGLSTRFETMVEDGGSGRFGSKESVYAMAWKQIKEAPLFGSYFRLLHGASKGNYPHNLIFELIMTFGIFLTAWFVTILWKVSKRSYQMLKFEGERTLIFLCFFYIVASLMFSHSLFLKGNFWALYALAFALSSVKPSAKTKALPS